MSTVLHSAIILPGSTIKFFCTDGMSQSDIFNVQHVLNFGGNMKFVNCAANNEYVGLNQAVADMQNEWLNASDDD